MPGSVIFSDAMSIAFSICFGFRGIGFILPFIVPGRWRQLQLNWHLYACFRSHNFSRAVSSGVLQNRFMIPFAYDIVLSYENSIYVSRCKILEIWPVDKYFSIFWVSADPCFHLSVTWPSMPCRQPFTALRRPRLCFSLSCD